MKTNLTALLFTWLLALSSALAQNIITVDNNPGAVAMFDNFADAYEAASDGDTILLAGSSNNYGDHTLYKRLKIVGPGYFLSENGIPGLSTGVATISLTLKNDPLIGSSSGTVLRGLEFSNLDVEGDLSGILVQKCRAASRLTWGISSPTIFERCFVVYDGSGLISFSSGSSGSLVSNSILFSLTFRTTGINVDRCVIQGNFNGNPSTSISNSIFALPTASRFTRNGTSVSHCMAIGFDYLPEGGGNINGQLISNVFVNTGSEDAKWKLKAGSTAAGAGTDGSDMGAFGGPNPYVLSGVPGIPRLTRFVVPATATSTSGLQFEIDAEAFAE